MLLTNVPNVNKYYRPKMGGKWQLSMTLITSALDWFENIDDCDCLDEGAIILISVNISIMRIIAPSLRQC